MITHGLPTGLADMAKKSGVTVHSYPSTLKNMLFVNPNKGPFVSVAARQALEQALNKSTLRRTSSAPRRPCPPSSTRRTSCRLRPRRRW